MKFRLIHTEVTHLKFDKLRSKDGRPLATVSKIETTYGFNINIFPDEERSKVFGVAFNVQMKHQDGFKIKMEYVAWFEADIDLTEENLDSPFTYINAPAIAFPFLRSYVSLITLNSGYRAVIIPTLNFVDLYKQSKESSIPPI